MFGPDKTRRTLRSPLASRKTTLGQTILKDDGGPIEPSNIMFDKRVVRGSIWAASTAAKEEEKPKRPHKGGRPGTRAVLQRTWRNPPEKSSTQSGTPRPVEGRQHITIQTDCLLEPLTPPVSGREANAAPHKSPPDLTAQAAEKEKLKKDIEALELQKQELLSAKAAEAAELERLRAEKQALTHGSLTGGDSTPRSRAESSPGYAISLLSASSGTSEEEVSNSEAELVAQQSVEQSTDSEEEDGGAGELLSAEKPCNQGPGSSEEQAGETGSVEHKDSVVPAGELGSLPAEPAELLEEGSEATSPEAYKPYEGAEAVELSGVAAIDQVRAMLSDHALLKTLSREEREAVHNFEADIKTPEEAEVHASDGGVQQEVSGVSDAEGDAVEAVHGVPAGKAAYGEGREVQSQAPQEMDDVEGRQEILYDATGDEGEALPAGQGPNADASSRREDALMLPDEKDGRPPPPPAAWRADQGAASEAEAHPPSGEEGGPRKVAEGITPVEEAGLPHKEGARAQVSTIAVGTVRSELEDAAEAQPIPPGHKPALQLPDSADPASEAAQSEGVALGEPEEAVPATAQDSDDPGDLPRSEGPTGLEEQQPPPPNAVIVEQADRILVDQVPQAGPEDAARVEAAESNDGGETPQEQQDAVNSGTSEEAVVKAELEVMLPAVRIDASKLQSAAAGGGSLLLVVANPAGEIVEGLAGHINEDDWQPGMSNQDPSKKVWEEAGAGSEAGWLPAGSEDSGEAPSDKKAAEQGGREEPPNGNNTHPISADGIGSATDCETRGVQAGQLPTEVLHPHAAESTIPQTCNEQLNPAGAESVMVRDPTADASPQAEDTEEAVHGPAEEKEEQDTQLALKIESSKRLPLDVRLTECKGGAASSAAERIEGDDMRNSPADGLKVTSVLLGDVEEAAADPSPAGVAQVNQDAPGQAEEWAANDFLLEVEDMQAPAVQEEPAPVATSIAQGGRNDAALDVHDSLVDVSAADTADAVSAIQLSPSVEGEQVGDNDDDTANVSLREYLREDPPAPTLQAAAQASAVQEGRDDWEGELQRVSSTINGVELVDAKSWGRIEAAFAPIRPLDEQDRAVAAHTGAAGLNEEPATDLKNSDAGAVKEPRNDASRFDRLISLTIQVVDPNKAVAGQDVPVEGHVAPCSPAGSAEHHVLPGVQADHDGGSSFGEQAVVGGPGVVAESGSLEGGDGLGQAAMEGGNVGVVPEGGKPCKKTRSVSSSARSSQGGSAEVEGTKMCPALPTALQMDVKITAEGSIVQIKQRDGPSESSGAVLGEAILAEDTDGTVGSPGEVVEESDIDVQQAPDEEEGEVLSGFGMAGREEAGAPTAGSAIESETHNAAEQDVRIFLPAANLNAAGAEPSADGAALARTCLQFTAPTTAEPSFFYMPTSSVDCTPAAGSSEPEDEGTASAPADAQWSDKP